MNITINVIPVIRESIGQLIICTEAYTLIIPIYCTYQLP